MRWNRENPQATENPMAIQGIMEKMSFLKPHKAPSIALIEMMDKLHQNSGYWVSFIKSSILQFTAYLSLCLGSKRLKNA